MSNTQYAFIQREQLPSPQALQHSLSQLGFAPLGFELRCDPQLDWLQDTGYSPCVLMQAQGEPLQAGFELFSMTVQELAEDDPDLAALADGRDTCISMTWHSSYADLAAVMMVSSALAKDFGAIISFEGDTPEEAGALIEQTHSILLEDLGNN